MQSNAILLVVLATFLIAATSGGAFHLFIANIAFTLLFPQQREIAGLTLDSSDLMFFMIAAGCVLSPQFAAPLRDRTIPHWGLWLLLGCVNSISYVATTSSIMGDPARAAYQLYRYCWKPILYYPLAASLIQNAPRRSWTFAVAIVVVGAVGSVLHLGGTSIAEQFVRHKNLFGGGLVAPAVLAVGLLLAQEHLLARVWIMAAAGLIWATIVLLGSRGAFVGASFGVALVALGLLRHTVGRVRSLRLAAAGSVVAALVIVSFPELQSSRGVAMLAELEAGTEVHNLQWRMTERWPHYIAMIKASPWLGTGKLHDDVAFTAGSKGTHNGYLAVALLRGIPACLLFFWIPIVSALRTRRVFRGRELPGRMRVLILAFGAAIAGILLHNLVDHTVVGAFTGQLFWTMTGIAGAAGLRTRAKSGRPVAQAARARRVFGKIRGQCPPIDQESTLR